MKYCDNCKVSVEGKWENCPLCQVKLSGDDKEQEDTFPVITFVYKEHTKFFKVMLLISIIIASISVSLNMLLPQRAWSLFILGGLGSVWASLITAINKRNNIPKNIVYQVMIISVVVIVWDLLTGWKGWSLDYVIPFICVFAMISMAVISKVLRLHIEDYLLYVIIDGMFGIIPIVFLLIGFLNVLYPTLICIVGSIISLSTILIFEGESLKVELKKRFHM